MKELCDRSLVCAAIWLSAHVEELCMYEEFYKTLGNIKQQSTNYYVY
jgi:hypothetical protein